MVSTHHVSISSVLVVLVVRLVAGAYMAPVTGGYALTEEKRLLSVYTAIL
jgi:hypothetical protein